MTSIKRIVISGPTGAIGIALIKLCIAHEVEVLALCNRGSKRIHQIPKSKYVEIVECSLADFVDFHHEKQYDVFYHLAWEGTTGDSRNDMLLQHRNILYTLHAVDLAKRLGCTRFVGAGSQAEYGRSAVALTPHSPVFPENGYGIAKLCAGQMSRERAGQLGLTFNWVRIFSIFGPFDGKNSMVMSTLNGLLENRALNFTKGEQIWDYLYSDDAATALFLIGQSGIDKKTYCLGSGQTRPLSEYILQMKEAAKSQSAIHFGAISYSDKQVMFLCADISELQNDVHFEPTTSFYEGIQKTLQSIKEETQTIKTSDQPGNRE